MTLLDDALMRDPLITTCAPVIGNAVKEWRDAGYPGTTETTRRLLAWWFDTDHEVDGQPFKFYEAQRRAIEALVYTYEVARRRNNRELLEAFLPNPDVRLLQHGYFARYAIKMATGSGKTMVMALSVVWSYLNSINEPEAGDYATSFLVIAPNVIVFERLQGDFAGGAAFRRFHMVPPEYVDQWSDLRFFMRGDKADVASAGAVYLANIQQLYDATQQNNRRSSGGVPAPIAGFLGPRASDAPSERDDFDERIVRRNAPVMVINDEAHHTHDEESAWNRTIRSLLQRNGNAGFMAQLDFSATPRFNDGALFPWVIYNYPLRQAIEDGIVKQPIRGELKDATEPQSDDVAVRYGAYITAAVQRWREYRDQLSPLGKKPVLFVMMENTREAEAVAAHLQEIHRQDFGGDRLQVIHTNNDGEFSTAQSRVGDLEKARSVVKNIDSDDSTINAVVSVMMLREGWDVRNVTVVLGLRPYTAAANILPEQAIGRGLRLMFPEQEGYQERVDIIGTDKFMEFVANLDDDTGPIPGEPVNGVPIQIVTITPDYANKGTMDIAIPNINPIYERRSDTRGQISQLDINTIEIANLPFSLEPLDDETFTYLGLGALTDEVEVRRIYRLPSPNTCSEVISYYATKIGSETNLPGHFDVIAEKVREFFANRAFGQEIDLEDNALALVLARPAIGYLAVQGFARAIRPLTRQEREPSLASAPSYLSRTEPFPWSRPTSEAGKTIFNLVAADNNFEWEFARFLESAPDVVRFAKLPTKFGFKIQYVANTGNIRHYYPDFVAVDNDGMHHLIETKGLEDPNVAYKDRAARLWCQNATQLTGTSWQFVKVVQVDFGDLGGRTLGDVISAFARS